MRIPALRAAALSPASLRAHLAASPGPLKLTGLIEHWPALSWAADSVAGLRVSLGAGRLVEVELGRRGRGYLDKDWQRASMPLGIFLDAFVLASRAVLEEAEHTAYLAQSELADLDALAPQIPALEHYGAGPRGDVYRRTLWVGPPHSFTPFHRDPYIGIYSQVVGEKTFHLLPSSAAPHLSLSPHPLHRNTSTIPLPTSLVLPDDADTAASSCAAESPIAHEHAGGTAHAADPSGARVHAERARAEREFGADTMAGYTAALERAFALPGAGRTTLRPGESVLVPEGWWHAAEGGAGPGVGVGAWFR
ncbi:hypothetical protein Q5752_003414 [Cryptotrichosporon argae]